MGNLRDGEFARWGICEMGNIQDGEFARWGICETGNMRDNGFCVSGNLGVGESMTQQHHEAWKPIDFQKLLHENEMLLSPLTNIRFCTCCPDWWNRYVRSNQGNLTHAS